MYTSEEKRKEAITKLASRLESSPSSVSSKQLLLYE